MGFAAMNTMGELKSPWEQTQEVETLILAMKSF